jgi:hypothetical protein
MLRIIPAAFFLMTIGFTNVISAMSPAVQSGQQNEIKVSKEVLKEYIGTYQLSPTSNMIVTLDGSKLMAQVSGAAKIQLSASSETKFFPKGVDAEIEFVKDDKGQVTHLMFRQSGREMKGARISEEAQTEMKLSPQILSRYVGVYRLHHGFDVEITRQGDQLYQKAGGQDLRLSAISETRFISKQAAPQSSYAFRQPSSQMEFVVGPTGPATELLMHRGPVPLKFRRIGDKPVEEKGIEVLPEILAKYAGTYLMGHNFQTNSDSFLNIIFKDGRLSAQSKVMEMGTRGTMIERTANVRLLAESESKFFTNSEELEFFKDDKGVAIYLTRLQYGMKATIPRVGEGWESKEATVPPEILAKYVGTYQLGPGFDLVISLKNGRLTSQATKQAEIQLCAQSETRFYPKETPLLIEFVKDEKGMVTALINHQMGMDTKAPRIGN